VNVELEGFELQAAIAAAAAESGQPVLDAGRGQPNWLATDPRDAAFVLGRFAVAEATAASNHPEWGMTPSVSGIAARLAAFAGSDDSAGAAFLRRAVDYGVVTFGFEPDTWVHELVRAVLGDGYPSPNRMLTHIERVVERYLTEVTGAETAPPGTYQVFGTEGGAAAMAYVFRSLQENGIVRAGDKVAIATPVFTPYLQIPVLEDFGLDVVEIHAERNRPARFGEGVLHQLLDPTIKVFFLVNPGNPDTRAQHGAATVDRRLRRSALPRQRSGVGPSPMVGLGGPAILSARRNPATHAGRGVRSGSSRAVQALWGSLSRATAVAGDSASPAARSCRSALTRVMLRLSAVAAQAAS